VARVLLIDDDAALLDVLSLAFEDAKHEVVRAADGEEGLRRLREARPHVVVSDVNMPRVDGFSLCKRVRESGDRVPLILLTSRDGEIDEALGLELGADDYVSKPFSTRVLLARVGALLRREELRALPAPTNTGEAASPRVLVSGALRLDPERLHGEYAGNELTLTVTEFRLLEAFASRPGLVLSRDRLLELARDDDSVVADRIIDTYVRRLRRKLEAVDPSFEAIETVIGAGYRWRPR